MNSGDIGFCERLGHPRGIVLTWENHTVVRVDCEHERCGFADSCELYRRKPVGYRDSGFDNGRSCPSVNPSTMGL